MARSSNGRMAAVLVAGCLVVASCSEAEVPEASARTPATPTADDAPQTTEAVTEAAVTSSPDPTLSAQEQDEADIEETLQRYTQALDDAFNGDASVEDIYPISRDTAREKWVTEVMASEAQGIESTGHTELEVLEVSVDGDFAEAVACADVTDVDAVNANGDSIISEDRLDQTLKDFVLERDDSAELGWYVVEDTNRNEPCDS